MELPDSQTLYDKQWETQSTKLQEEEAKSRHLSENESQARETLDRKLTSAEAKHEAEKQDLVAKLRAADERARGGGHSSSIDNHPTRSMSQKAPPTRLVAV